MAASTTKAVLARKQLRDQQRAMIRRFPPGGFPVLTSGDPRRATVGDHGGELRLGRLRWRLAWPRRDSFQ